MKRNLDRYSAYQASRNLLFWLPVFFLYFSSVLPIDRVLLLEAIYYLAVVVLEVPSGYLSDRLGRRPTLMAAMAAWAGAGLVFAATGSFGTFAAAQVLLAAGMALNSGTDSALLYDTLVVLDRTDEYGDREARAHSAGLAAMGISALAGGVLAGFDLRIAYLLSALGGAVALAIAMTFTEPPRTEVAAPIREQAAHIWRGLGDPVLRWVLAFWVGMTVLNHVPYELFQPWLELALGGADAGAYALTPAASGALVAATMLQRPRQGPRARPDPAQHTRQRSRGPAARPGRQSPEPGDAPAPRRQGR